MELTPRVKDLQQASKAAVPTLDPERAQLLTRFYQETDLEGISIPIQRARAFEYILLNKEISIEDGELLVGEKGSGPRQAPTYPELCTHSLADLEILDQRNKVSFKVEDQTREIYQTQIIPFWEGKTTREKLLGRMSPAWLAAYQAGVFTEFMEQRSPGHTVLDDKIYHKGMEDFLAEIEISKVEIKQKDPDSQQRLENLEAMAITARALISYAARYAELAQKLAAEEKDPERKAELEEIAEICRRVPAQKPRTFQEALQYYWFVHLGVTLELNPWDAFCPGHLDQHLEPFYQRGLDDGSLTQSAAEELLACLWIKFDNQPAPPKVGVTAEESGTYTDFVQINLGGQRADGSSAANPISYLMLDTIQTMKQVQPNPSVHISEKTPDEFLLRAMEVIREGMGKPDLFNSDMVVKEMLRVGKDLVDARQGGTSGCVETGAFGKEAYILTGYFNIPKVFEITLHNGIDPLTGQKLGIETGDPVDFVTYQDFFEAFKKQLAHFIDIKIEGNLAIERLFAEELPAPFLSLITDDCIQKGLDYHQGGARYNTSYIQGVGLGTVTDALSAVKTHVFDEENLKMAALLELLGSDFKGGERERQLLMNRTPRFGNDDDQADRIAQDVFNSFVGLIDGRPNTRGGTHHVNMLPTTCHIYFGSKVSATPDGRRSGLPLSEGISPVQGADRKGPTAVLNSTAKIDHSKTGGTLLNQKLNPSLIDTPAGLEKIAQLVRGYFKLGGHHIQFNVVDRATLEAARENPEAYRDLIVRVAGYSDYFCDLSEALQLEIISRTEHQGL
jgi:pyruvate formate-lyase/glycerol dehydratase family glycyl radical enzyme